LIQINSGSLMFTLSGCLAMSQDLTPLLDHLNGLIFLADLTRIIHEGGGCGASP
jgi:hypothetical protein